MQNCCGGRNSTLEEKNKNRKMDPNVPAVVPYAYFREDKEAEPGFTPELISHQFQYFKDRTSIDELNCWPFNGVDTQIKALYRLKERIPNNDMLGTNVGGKYEWMTVSEVVQTAKTIAAGIKSFGLFNSVEADGRDWRFIGLQSKNRKEWNLIHIANMHNNVTTVALYDTLGEDASRYICSQTELTTIGCSADLIQKICTLKKDDQEGKA